MTANVSVQSSQKLECKCGNRNTFIEVMSFESHIVDGDLNYVHLLDAQTDHYTCADCGEEVPLSR